MTLKPGTTYHYRVLAAKAKVTEDTLEWEGPPAYGPDQTFTTPPAEVGPKIESESVSNVTATDATLEATINPGGGEDGLETAYQFFLEAPSCFSYGFGACEASGGVPIASGVIPSGSSTRTVSVDVASVWHPLSPATIYGYRVVATNSAGEAFGRLKEFTTLPGRAAPVIDSVSVSHLTPTDATLEAQINTEDQATIYEFLMWYSPCAMCEDIAIFKIDLPFGLLLGSSQDQSVSLDLNSAGVTLSQGAEYGYSMKATNASGSTETQWQTFQPPPGVLDPPGPGVGPGPVSGEPAVPLVDGQQTDSGTPGSSSTDSPSKHGVAELKSKHGKHRKHRRHGTKAAKQLAKTKKH
jgi:hypothetical protein